MRPFLALIALTLLPAPPAWAQAATIYIEDQPLAEALNFLSEKTGAVIMARADDLPEARAGVVSGAANVEEALKQLLQGTGLTYRSEQAGVWVIRPEPSPRKTPAATPFSPPLTALTAIVPPSRPVGELPRIFNTIIVTGSRNMPSALESMSPIELVPQHEIHSLASDDLIDVLAQLMPSFSAQRLPLSDGSVFVRPSRLRNLSPDHTLVLVNGKRRHKSALLGANGAQAPDLAQIPATAIGRIEILRDGASAQYGADAIAGVINIITRDSAGLNAFSQYSQYQEGDGQQTRIGLSWGEDFSGSHVNLTAEYSHAAATSRARQRVDAIAYQAANPQITLPDPVQRWGQPEREDFRSFFSLSSPTGASGVLYAHGNFNQGTGVSDFNWRHPDSQSVYGESEAFPGFTVADLFPHGFTPQFGQDSRDGSAIAGYRREEGDLSIDVSAGAGQNRIDYFLFNTVNASMGPESPTSFDAGGLRQTELNFNADLRHQLMGLAGIPLSVAYGLEHRTETYTIRAGEPASYLIGPGARDGLTSGSNGFPGYTPLQADDYVQRSSAGYVDIETDLSGKLRVGTAARFETYSGFGQALTGKISARYELTPALAVRATASTGFRPPTPGQIFGERTSQGVNAVSLDVFTQGRFTAAGPVADILNQRSDTQIHPLTPETSENLSAGVVFSLAPSLLVTLDAYQVEIDDRFTESEVFVLTEEERARLTALNVPGGESITEVFFYQNDFSTRSRGVDLIARYDLVTQKGNLALKAAYNYNDTAVTNASFIADQTRVQRFEEFLPAHTGILSARYGEKRWSVDGRLRIIGPWSDFSDDASTTLQKFSTIAMFDLGVNWSPSERWQIRLGAENLFNTYPDEARLQSSKGLIYSRNAPHDTDGGLYSLRLTYTQ